MAIKFRRMKDKQEYIDKLHTESKDLSESIIRSLNEDSQVIEERDEERSSDKVYNYVLKKGAFFNHISKYQEFSAKQGYLKFLNAIEESYPKLEKRNIKKHYWLYSAAATVAVIFGLFLYLKWSTDKVISPTINHGISKATLILPNGKKISASSEDFTYKQENVSVNYKKGSFSYVGNVSSDSLVENTLVVPMGGEANMTLSDGTKVWLNADSRLKHPVKFIGKNREVTVSGEAYFEVAEDKNHPFIVHTSKGDVKVLGTGFGITSYPEEKAFVTLAHGKIAFSDNAEKMMYLKPGEQVKIEGGKWEKRTVNIEEYVGWKDGKFVFHNRTLSDIMNTMERWYNVEIVFETPKIKDVRFSGDIRRYESINVFLEALVLTRELEYSVEGKTIRLYQK